MFQELRSPEPQSRFDLTGDGVVDTRDRDELIVKILGSTYGDANLDGFFDSADLVSVFQAGRFEMQPDGDATWAEGDWNGDGSFDSSDLVLALQFGGFENRPLIPRL